MTSVATTTNGTNEAKETDAEIAASLAREALRFSGAALKALANLEVGAGRGNLGRARRAVANVREALAMVEVHAERAHRDAAARGVQ